MPPDPNAAVAMVVDDERALRMIVRLALQHLGFRVLEAATGEEALPLAQAEPSPLALAVIDLTLPGQDGLATAAQLRGPWPALPILLTSGYDQPAVSDFVSAHPPAAFLLKPFARKALVGAIERLLVARL